MSLWSSLSQAALVADTAAPQAAAPQQGNSAMPFLMIGFIVIMFFMMFRSNKKQRQQRAAMLDGITRGNRVLLGSGIYGKVLEVKDKEFVVEIAPNVNVSVAREGIANVIAEETAAPAADK